MAHQQVDQYIDPALPLDNSKHEEFCLRYALKSNATEAYVQVYGCSRDAAGQSGFHLLNKPNVRSRVNFIQSLSNDIAFAELTQGMSATKVLIHDKDAVLTRVEDTPTRIAAAVAILKANGRIGSVSTPINIDQSTNYTLVSMTQAAGIEQVADKLMLMNAKLMERKAKPHNVIDAQITQTNGT